MSELPTFQELYDAGKAEVQSRNAELTDYNEGSVLDGVTGAGAMLADEVIRVVVDLFAALFIDTAEGDELDALAADRFGLSRKAASAAIGRVLWTRDAAGAYVIPAGTRMQGTVGDETIVVETTSDTSMLASDTVVSLVCQATTTGRAGNIAAGTIDTVLDTVAADAGATVNNVAAFAGGAAEETDEGFRARIRAYFQTLQRATRAALVFGATSVPGVEFATVDEQYVDAAGITYVYIGDPDAGSSGPLEALVEAELENWRAAGVRVFVNGASREEIELQLLVTIQAGVDQDDVGQAVRAAIVGYGDSLGPGTPARISRIEAACHDASDLVVAVDVLSHDEDISPTATQDAIRFIAEDIQLLFLEA